MQYRTQIFCFFALIFIGSPAFAQNLEFGLIAGGAGYMGDLNQSKPLKISGLSAGANVKVNFDPYWTLGLHYTYGKIKENDLHSDNVQFQQRRLNFKSTLNELSLQVDFNFFEYFAGGGTKNFTPYIFAGIGGVWFNPIGKYNLSSNPGEKEYELRFYRTEGQKDAYRNVALTVPYGVGFKVRLKENWGLFSQIGYRTAYTDYLDDVSGRYPSADFADGDTPEVGPIRRQLADPSLPVTNLYGTQRGDLRKRDTYMFVGIGISYTFVSQKCYTF
ncbi:outer membrane beta-barrel protein [Pedobacter sp. N36a]|uniref:type IX secretion system protein PorG n=1 Tax=Pedobacter sp. N36a TaxID=2767996 RepID=UPI0016572863|nr:DUF6089 family protein [Pedobacter sp. N36a]MBC8987395.1 outer membrane beta-barrel protein [Pedobacter sp. N36a]